MAVSKRTRFEVFKRDAFACQYCGRMPPAVMLQVDHINPQSAGGCDEIDNLLTACADCNLGKSNVPLDCLPSSLSEKVEVLEEKREQLAALNEMLEKDAKTLKRHVNHICRHFKALFPGHALSLTFKTNSLPTFLKHFSYLELESFMSKAASKQPRRPDDALRYFCGICWRKIKEEDNG